MATKNRKRSKWRTLLWILTIPVVLVAAFVLFCNVLVSLSTFDRVYATSSELPENTVGVVLGTSKNVAPNTPNTYFTSRMQAAAELFRSGKVKHILVSGANNSRYYNEPADMEKALTQLGVPVSAITRDQSGFRTLDSVVRAKNVFGQERYTIITDGNHVNRAVFLAQTHRQDVVGYVARSGEFRPTAKSRVREIFARVKAVLDVFIFRTKPREEGELDPIRIALTERV